MLAVQDRRAEAEKALERLDRLNIGGRLNNTLNQLRRQLSELSISAPSMSTH
jgi:hypothetical protein